ncbi:MAG: type II toxin-antitoxin system RelE/ParE family toxin [bacterium]
MKNFVETEKEIKKYSIILKRTPQKFLENLDDKSFDKIDEKILSLKVDPFLRQMKKLEVFDCYRVRVGDYRILYTVDSKEYIITILDIANRKDIYKKK